MRVKRRNAKEREDTKKTARQSTQGNLDRHTAAIAARVQEKKDNAQVQETAKSLKSSTPKKKTLTSTQRKVKNMFGRIKGRNK